MRKGGLEGLGWVVLPPGLCGEGQDTHFPKEAAPMGVANVQTPASRVKLRQAVWMVRGPRGCALLPRPRDESV